MAGQQCRSDPRMPHRDCRRQTQQPVTPAATARRHRARRRRADPRLRRAPPSRARRRRSEGRAATSLRSPLQPLARPSRSMRRWRAAPWLPAPTRVRPRAMACRLGLSRVPSMARPPNRVLMRPELLPPTVPRETRTLVALAASAESWRRDRRVSWPLRRLRGRRRRRNRQATATDESMSFVAAAACSSLAPTTTMTVSTCRQTQRPSLNASAAGPPPQRATMQRRATGTSIRRHDSDCTWMRSLTTNAPSRRRWLPPHSMARHDKHRDDS